MAVRHDCRKQVGFTLVELLVVIAIIGILVALLLPAIQAAREAARRSQCTNNLKQLGIACHLHVDTHGFLPSGGWGDWWVGCPDQGAGEKQPGNWAYQLLPFIEESARAQVGQGFKCGDPNSRTAIGQMVATHVNVFYCPSRRAAQPYPWTNTGNYNFSPPPLAGKTDYAGNLGGEYAFVGMNSDLGPPTLMAAETYAWRFSGTQRINQVRTRYPAFNGLTGTIFQRSEIKFSQITDGTAFTYLLGEKNLDPNHYDTGFPPNDDQSMYNGHDRDNLRAAFSWYPATPQGYTGSEVGVPQVPAMPDTPGTDFSQWNFGGPHSGGWVALFCDGSVQFLTYDLGPQVHQNFGTRNDGNVTTAGGS